MSDGVISMVKLFKFRRASLLGRFLLQVKMGKIKKLTPKRQKLQNIYQKNVVKYDH